MVDSSQKDRYLCHVIIDFITCMYKPNQTIPHLLIQALLSLESLWSNSLLVNDYSLSRNSILIRNPYGYIYDLWLLEHMGEGDDE